MSKRSRTDARSGDRITIDVGGTLFKTSRSTLSACAYFARALSDDWSSNNNHQEQDEPILFLDRDEAQFRWVLSFLRSGNLPLLPPFAADKGRWRALRQEAEFLGCDSLVSYLGITERLRFEHTRDSNGILYWLGCERGQKTYKNPAVLGQVRLDCSKNPTRRTAAGNLERQFDPYDICCFNPSDDELFPLVEHDPGHTFKLSTHPTQGSSCVVSCTHALDSGSWCEVATPDPTSQLWVQLDLVSLSLSPTHYSLADAGGQCCSAHPLKDLDLLGSVDGQDWEILHSVRDDFVKRMTELELEGVARVMEDCDQKTGDLLHAPIAARLSQTLHKTWAITAPPNRFYRYFRLTVPPLADDPNYESFHVAGFELYGDVHEE